MAFELLGGTLERFVSVDPIMVPTDDGSKSGVFLTTSYDATSHFETTCRDVLDVYKRITGQDLDLDKPRPKLPGEEESGAAAAGAQ